MITILLRGGTMNEKINHPSHYQKEGRKECIEEIREFYGDIITAIFCLTNAYKYLYRAGMKEGNSAEQDIAKAKWYWDYIDKLNGNEIVDRIIDGMSDMVIYLERELEKYENNQSKL